MSGGQLTAHAYCFVAFADITKMIASPDGPMFRVPTTTGWPSSMLMSVFRSRAFVVNDRSHRAICRHG